MSGLLIHFHGFLAGPQKVPLFDSSNLHFEGGGVHSKTGWFGLERSQPTKRSGTELNHRYSFHRLVRSGIDDTRTIDVSQRSPVELFQEKRKRNTESYRTEKYATRWMALLPFLFWGEGFPTKIDYRKKGTLILTSLLEDLG